MSISEEDNSGTYLNVVFAITPYTFSDAFKPDMIV